MARQIVWTENAQRERLAVLRYWLDRNGSGAYSRKLDLMFRSSLRLIAAHPKLGRPTDDEDVRVKAVGDYLLFYTVSPNAVHVLSLWHGKQDPTERPF